MARTTLAAQWRASFDDGPMSALCVLRGQRVRVICRRHFGLRSIAEGRLEVFDRHWNLMLRRAVENVTRLEQHPDSLVSEGPVAAAGTQEPVEFSPATAGDSGTADPQSVHGTRAVWHRRSSSLLLVRGDCIVSVCKLDVPERVAERWVPAPSNPGSEAFRRLAGSAARRGLCTGAAGRQDDADDQLMANQNAQTIPRGHGRHSPL